MEALHAIRPTPIVHRDLKAANVMLANGRSTCKIADFGLAKFNAQSGGGTYGVGTLSHSAPETFVGTFNEKTDGFSFGLVLYELVTRKEAGLLVCYSASCRWSPASAWFARGRV
jgi:serine/threonine-protein kinase